MKKQGLVALALAVTTAAIASSFAPVPRPIETAMTSVPGPTRGPVIEIRQAPVPLLMKARQPFKQPTFDSDVVGPASVSAPSAPASDRFGDRAAKAAIEVVSLMANFKDAPGANDRHASAHPTAGGTRWAP